VAEDFECWARLYDALGDGCDHDELGRIAGLTLGGRWVAIAGEGDGSEVRVVANYALPHLPDGYSDYYRSGDLWWTRRPDAPDQFIDASTYVDRETWRATPLYQDLLRPHDVEPEHCLTGAFRIGATRYIIGVGRPAGEAFSEVDLRKANRILPHLRRVMLLRDRLDQAGQNSLFSEAALDSLAAPILRLDQSGRILYENRSATMLLRRGEALAVRNGQLSGLQPALADQIAVAIQAAVHRVNDGAMTVLAPKSRANGQAQVFSFSPILRGGVTQVLVVGSQPEGVSSQRVADLTRLFGLTPAEADLAVGLADGLTITEIATLRRVSVNTLRVQLRALLRKTGTSRQAELVSVLLRVPKLNTA
jgi:DNA-binding CsgD family transcriptional regulator/PAS domain-containing protein